ncbi:MAG: LysE family translocator [Chitinispirillaceae bacterium]|nr:LysE family translocator [Chitinispirillaceae bacterium]
MMNTVTHTLTVGITLGLSAGLAPGPLLTLVITETLRHDVGAGLKVALAPLITDVPIIFASLFVLAKLSGYRTALSVISLAGGIFVLYLGYESIRSKGTVIDKGEIRARSLSKALVTNLLNPHPYLFWLSVGGPIMTKAVKESFLAPLLFTGGFYMALVGSKMALAVVVGKSKAFLNGKAYRYIMRFLGAVLCGLAVILFRDGVRLLGW